jgi:hypothetical protein
VNESGREKCAILGVEIAGGRAILEFFWAFSAVRTSVHVRGHRQICSEKCSDFDLFSHPNGPEPL